ncbi:hypothetical protein SUGI_1197630 [Cryptomeria japonica]|uniref:uncharacterized protein LOC131070700 n=1 Tax=Cryptomeria japonica TaxID=3369 RepID=UPI00241479DC|nr:uncharacterized protein LOC131070700 [Cryptomeria japonica]GLJ55773.1 hypothetical protein SUGI_1197630 [Cryptomeria japonica]
MTETMVIEKEDQLLVVIPCEFIHHSVPSEDGWSHSRPCGDHHSSTENMTETDFEAAQQLLQLSSQSFESTEDDGEDASSCVANRRTFLSTNDRAVPRKSRSSAVTAASRRRQLTAKDTADGVNGGTRRRYKAISYIYDITRPTGAGRNRRSVKRRKLIAFF